MSLKPFLLPILVFGVGLTSPQTLRGQTVIPSSLKMPDGSVDTSKSGFAISIHQMEAERPSGNNLPDPVRQVRGELIDDATGLPVENLLDTFYAGEENKWVPNPSFTVSRIYLEDGVINYHQDSRDNPDAGQGQIRPDKPIPGIPGITGSTDNIAFEAVTFLELTAGTHAMVVNSDDGFVVKTGASPLDLFGTVLGIFDGGRGASDTAFDVVVQEDGIYPFVLQWWEGGGGANVEWFTVVEGERILINDTSNSKAIKAYREASVSRPYVASVDPAPGAFGVSLKPTIEVKIEDGDAKVSASTVKLSVNGQEVSASASKSGGTTTVSYTPAADLPHSTDVQVELTYGDDANPPNLVQNSFSFLTERLPIDLPPLRQDGNGLVVIEAENFNLSLAKEGDRWEFAKTPADFTGEGAMYALPEQGQSNGNAQDAMDLSPRLDFEVEFNRTGTHYIWWRGSDGGGDSLHVALNGDLTDTGVRIDSGCCGDRTPGGTTWHWIRSLNSSTVDAAGVDSALARFDVPSAGVHTVNFWMREDGTIVDKLVITSNPDFVPTGSGPAESFRVGASFKPIVSITSPSDGATLASGSAVTITADASDADGTVAKVEFFQGRNKIGEATSAPFTIEWTPDSERSYSLSAKVTDNSGATNESLAVAIVYGQALQVVFFANESTPDQSDSIMIEHLRETFGFFVTTIEDNVSAPEDVEGKDLIMISSTVGSGNIGDKYTDVAIPILNWEEALNDNLLYSGDSGSDPDHHGTTGGQTALDIVNADHPLAGGLPVGTVEVFSGPATMSWGYPESNEQNAIIIATLAGDPVKVGLYGYEKGATLFDGFSTAAERRVMFFLQSNTGQVLNETGFHLFDSAVSWLLRLPPPEPPAAGGGEPATLAIARSGNAVTVSWEGAGTLQEADAVTGPWTNSGSQSNPQDVSLMGTAKFYRVRQ